MPRSLLCPTRFTGQQLFLLSPEADLLTGARHSFHPNIPKSSKTGDEQLNRVYMETGQWVDGDLHNGRFVLIANCTAFEKPIFNYSGDFPFLWDEI
jgi:hypothetical protein